MAESAAATGGPVVVLRITVRAPDLDWFVDKYADHVDGDRIFLFSKNPQPVGTKVRFALQLVSGEPLLKGEGVVIRIQEDKGDRRHPPGMELRFRAADDRSQTVVDFLLATRAARSDAPLVRAVVPKTAPPPMPAGGAVAKADAKTDDEPPTEVRAVPKDDEPPTDVKAAKDASSTPPIGPEDDEEPTAVKSDVSKVAKALAKPGPAKPDAKSDKPTARQRPPLPALSSVGNKGAKPADAPSDPGPSFASLAAPIGAPAPSPPAAAPAPTTPPEPAAASDVPPGLLPARTSAGTLEPKPAPPSFSGPFGGPAAPEVPLAPLAPEAGDATHQSVPPRRDPTPTGPIFAPSEAKRVPQLGPGLPAAGTDTDVPANPFSDVSDNAIEFFVEWSIEQSVGTRTETRSSFSSVPMAGPNATGAVAALDDKKAPPAPEPPAATPAAALDDLDALPLPRRGGWQRTAGALAAGIVLGIGGTLGVQALRGPREAPPVATTAPEKPATPKTEGAGDEAEKPADKPAVAEAATAALSVVTRPPGATVKVDGEDKGHTPLELQVKAGPHEITVEKERYAAQTETVEAPGAMKVDLKRPLAALKIDSTPTGAQVTVQGVARGTTPVEVKLPGFERYNVEVALAGAKPWKKAVYLDKPANDLVAALGPVKGGAKPAKPAKGGAVSSPLLNLSAPVAGRNTPRR